MTETSPFYYIEKHIKLDKQILRENDLKPEEQQEREQNILALEKFLLKMQNNELINWNEITIDETRNIDLVKGSLPKEAEEVIAKVWAPWNNRYEYKVTFYHIYKHKNEDYRKIAWDLYDNKNLKAWLPIDSDKI